MKYVLSIVKNWQDAEDICQETWMVIAKKIDTFNFGSNELLMKSYILKIAKNRSLDYLKLRNNEIKFTVDELDGDNDELSTTDDALYSLCAQETVEEIVKCIESLGDVYKDVMLFYYVNENTVNEISMMLKLGVKTVRKRIERGRKQLIEMLKNRRIQNGK